MNKEVLQEARAVYGDDNQLSVAIEEMAELTQVLSKYFRYDDKIKGVAELLPQVISEVADVYIVLEHVKAIFGLEPRDIDQMVFMKIDRLRRWLEQSSSAEVTLTDRSLHDNRNNK